MPFDKEVDVGPGDIMLDGDPVPPKGTQPQIFGPCLLWPTAGWMNIPFGTEVGIGPGDIVLNGDSAPLERGTASPTFRPMSIVATWLDVSRCHLIRR